MAVEFKVPNLGENVTSGDVVNVLVKEGDVIVGNQGVIELETDKAVVEVPCPHAGKVAKVLVKQGETVEVGQTILLVEPEEAAPPMAAAAAPTTATKAEPQMVKATPGESIRPDRRDLTSAQPQETVAPSTPALEKTIEVATEPVVAGGVIPAGPAARRLARELNVDLTQVIGTGRHGRITLEDVHKASENRVSDVTTHVPQPVTPPGEADQDAWGPVRREKMSKIRKTIAAQMARSWAKSPRVTNFDDADVTDLENVRKSVPADFLGEGLKLTLMPFIMRAVAIALRHHPLVNASLDEEKEEIIYKEYVNLGIAVDTARGLVVPVVRNADQLRIPELAKALATATGKARNVEFTVDDIRGGTFTISNLGAVGGTYSTPIINYPEVAILLVGRSRWMPVVREGQVVPRYMMPLSLSYDHRLVDGATAARFVNEVIDWLQSPGKLLLVS